MTNPVPRSASRPFGDRLLLVVGARRSGTFWLHRVLTAHPDVAAVPGETYLFADGIRPLVDRFHHGVGASPATGFIYMDRPALVAALRVFCDEVFSGILDVLHAPDARYLLERTPWHVDHLDLISEIYPEVRVIHIIRDGRDVARSLVSMRWGPADVAAAAAEWAASVRVGRETGPRLRHYLEVRYEDLLADPDGGARSLFEWLGLPTGDALMAEVRREAGRVANVDKQAPKVGSGKWRQSWSAEDVAAFERVAGSLLRELGYTPTDAGPTDAGPTDAGPTDAGPTGPGTSTAPPASVSITERSRELLQRFVGKRSRDELVPPPRRPGVKSELTKLLLDSLIGLADRHRYDDLPELFEPDAEVRVVTRTDEWRGHGDAGLARLADTFRADEADRLRQTRGEFYVDGSTWVGLVTYEDATGAVHHRAYVVIVGTDLIRTVAYHQL